MDETFLKEVQAIVDRVKDARPSDIYAISVAGSEDGIFNIKIPSTMIPNGSTARELRDAGYVFSDTIPDCAVMLNGKFEWLDVKFTIEDKK